MKNIFILFSLVFLLVIKVNGDTSLDVISISKIKLIIEEKEYVWDEKDKIPEKGEEDITSPFTIISFLNIFPGQKISLLELEKEVKTAKNRLINSGFFYKVNVVIIPPREKLDYRTILIKTKEGFLYRFGGGKIYGMFGMDNLDGKRKSFKVFLGTNPTGIEFIDESFLESHFLMGAKAHCFNIFDSPVANYQLFKASFLSGYFIHSDIFLGLDFFLKCMKILEISSNITPEFLGGLERNDIVISPNFSFKSYEETSLAQFEFNINGRVNFILPLKESESKISYIVRGAAKMKFSEEHSVNLQVSTGGANETLPYMEKFNLYDTQDISIRGGYNALDLLVDRFLLINTEWRFCLAKFFVPPFFNTRIEGFIYLDNGWIGKIGEEKYLTNYYDGYGPGIRLLFDNPVFAYFSFSYGTNLSGQTRFIFTGTAGF
ncbi:MAG: hypothetical protein ABH873_10205 [Candidatus Firestonebacteria bacterium]